MFIQFTTSAGFTFLAWVLMGLIVSSLSQKKDCGKNIKAFYFSTRVLPVVGLFFIWIGDLTIYQKVGAIMPLIAAILWGFDKAVRDKNMTFLIWDKS